MDAVSSLRVVALVSMLLGGLPISCANDAGTAPADASLADAVANDLGVDRAAPVDDLAADRPAPVMDVPRDASMDTPDVAMADHPDVVTTSDAFDWSDVPRVDFGGISIPVDPAAVPAPGSECVGDGSLRDGDPSIAPPRPIRPLSVSRASSQRPTFQWVLAEGTTGARVEVCADRCCTRVLQTLDADGTTVRPTATLPPGVVFWRMFGRTRTAVGSRASVTWEFEVKRRDAPHDTSWGTIRDFDGDGFDDLVGFDFSDSNLPMLLARGSDHGLLAPVPAGIRAEHSPIGAAVGDFNGDGVADIVWGDHDTAHVYGRSWFVLIEGARSGFHLSAQPNADAIGACGRLGPAVATDWNGDGYSDVLAGVLLGCDIFSPVTASFLFVYFGSPTGIAEIPQRVERMDGILTYPGVDLGNSLGDVDVDGYGDVYLASSHSGNGTSSIPIENAIAHGNATGNLRLELIADPTAGSDDWAYPQPVAAGDLDGDGRIDFSLRLDYHEPVLVYRSGSGWSAPTSSLVDPVPNSYFGQDRGATDVNGDGLADLVVSSPDAHTEEQAGLPLNRGRVYVYLGSTSGISTIPMWIGPRRTPMEDPLYGIFGQSMACPGDVNGDGFDDVVISDSYDNGVCVRLGGTGFVTGVPDQCIAPSIAGGVWY